MQAIAAAPADEKKLIGRYANELKQAIEARWTEYRERAAQTARPAGAVDVTLPGRVRPLGRRHPLTIVRERMEEIFTRMGFTIVEGPEVEDEWHCFDALNMPAEHPARDMQDTLYLASPIRGESGRDDDVRTLAAHAHLVDADSLHAGAHSRRSASSCRDGSIGATISISPTRRRSRRWKGWSSAKASRWRI